MDGNDKCVAGSTVWMGQHCTGTAFAFDDATALLTTPECPNFCAGVTSGSTLVSLVKCTDTGATGFAKIVGGLRTRGVYVEMND